MKFIYAPEDPALKDEGWEVEFDMERPRMTAGEGVFLERHHKGKPLSDIFEESSRGSTTAMLSILFVYRKRSVPALRYQDFEDSIVLDDLQVEMDVPTDDEVADEAGPKDDESPEVSEAPDGAESGTSPTSS